MFGKRVGSVTDVELAPDPRPGRHGQLAARVAFVLEPERLARRHGSVSEVEANALASSRLHAVLQTGNLLTGQRVLSVDYGPQVASSQPLEGGARVLPGEAQGLQEISGAIASVAQQIDEVPFQEIAQHLNAMLASLQSTVAGPELKRSIAKLETTLQEVHQLAVDLRAGLSPALARLPRISQKLEHAVTKADAALGREGYGPSSAIQRELERVMDQTAQAARSIRLLADYLQRHPEAVLTGRAANQP